MKQQKHKKFYCKVDKHMAVFIEHADRKGKWICTCCRFTTTNPTEKIAKIKQLSRGDFLNLLLKNQREKLVMNWRIK